jgi:NADPH-dependent 2,4-dienoyl-CoA reductase/sulfur reductase-like enzyme
LRTGRSVWEAHRAPPVPHQPLKHDIETDVLVVGAGITGAMVADALRDSRLRVAVVDRRGPPGARPRPAPHWCNTRLMRR